MKTTITNAEFDLFLNSCEISFNAEQYGHSSTDYDMKGYMNDSEGERIATIDFVKGTTEVEKEIYIDDETCFSPSVIQEAKILDAIDKGTSIDRERWVDEFLNQETC
jgi:hypothetical protein